MLPKDAATALDKLANYKHEQCGRDGVDEPTRKH